jgi:hypothetical protein
MEDLRALGWRLLVEKVGTTSRLRRGGQLSAAIVPAVFPLLVVVIGLGLWLALARTSDTSSAERVLTWLVITVTLALWLLVVSILARRGAYRARLALPAGVLLPPAIGLFLLTRLPHLPQLLDATPKSWLIGLMVVRLVGGVFLAAWASGEVAKPWFNVSAGSIDIIVGVTALPVALWVSSGSTMALAIGIAWNLLGLLDFALAMGLARIFPSGGPSHMVSLNTPIVAALKPSIIGILAFGVPLSIMVHVLSLWQLLAA